MTPFWYRLIPAWAPSWLVELVSGLLAVAAVRLALLLPLGLIVLVLATIINVAYELKLDPHGWSWLDVGQREVGVLVGVLLVGLL